MDSTVTNKPSPTSKPNPTHPLFQPTPQTSHHMKTFFIDLSKGIAAGIGFTAFFGLAMHFFAI